MAEITISVSDKERNRCLQAIDTLNKIPHLRAMSVNTIAETAGIKETKCRAVLCDLIAAGYVTKYCVSDNRKIQRYYYTIEQAGQDLLEAAAHGKGSK